MSDRRSAQARPIPAADESERQTRRTRIDPKLVAQGWKVVKFTPATETTTYERHAVAEFPTRNGPADYALVVSGRILGIVEAKKVSLGPQNVLVQAERHSKGVDAGPIDTRGYRVPFLYATNGEVIWFQDVRHKLNVSRRIAGFHTPAALAEMFGRDFDAECAWFADNPNTHPRLRPYQIEASVAIEQATAARKRQMLVAMATGTGKTFTMVNEVYRMMRAGVGKRIRPNRDLVLEPYLAAYLASPYAQGWMKRRYFGMDMPRINVEDARALPVALPPLEEQHEIVRRVDALFKLAEAIEQRVAGATARADRPTQAVLAKAFRGELVPTEAELARRAGRSYEPATELLARIREERASAPCRSPRRKARSPVQATR